MLCSDIVTVDKSKTKHISKHFLISLHEGLYEHISHKPPRIDENLYRFILRRNKNISYLVNSLLARYRNASSKRQTQRSEIADLMKLHQAATQTVDVEIIAVSILGNMRNGFWSLLGHWVWFVGESQWTEREIWYGFFPSTPTSSPRASMISVPLVNRKILLFILHSSEHS